MSVSPKVSIIIIFLNASRFICEAIDSVLAQTYPDWELLLVDDGSTDGSTQIAKSYATRHSGRIRYYEHEQHANLGLSASRNLGIRSSCGLYVAFLDADDVWLPRKLERQVAILDSQSEAALVYGASQYWYSWTGIPSDATRDYICDVGVCPDTLFQPCTLLNLLLKGLHSPGPSDFMVRREALHRVGGFEESFKGRDQLYEDQAFLAKVYLQEPVFVSNECWDRYRVHEDSCNTIVMSTGQDGAARLFFLNWLRAHLTEKRVENAELLTNFRHAFASHIAGAVCDQPNVFCIGSADVSETRSTNWWLKVGRDNVAAFEISDDKRDTARVVIVRADTSIRHDVQLNYTRLRVDDKITYVISFTARADRHRSIGVGVAMSYPPWENLGLYRDVELSPEWRSFEERFVATSDAKNARIHFDLGESNVSVEFGSVRLLRALDGRWVTPDFPLA